MGGQLGLPIFSRPHDTLCVGAGLGAVNNKQSHTAPALSSLPLVFILGWSLAAWGLEHRDPLEPSRVEVREIPGVGEIPGNHGIEPLELRHVPGVGRTRSRDLARGLWDMGLGVLSLQSAPSLQRVSGIGPVTGAAVERWAASRAPGPYTGGKEIHPAVACLPPKSIRVHSKRAFARPPAGTTPGPAPRIP